MRDALLALVCLSSVLGCGLSNLNPQNSNLVDQTRPTPSPFSSTPTPSPTPSPTPTPKLSVGAILKKSVGKYPYEIKMLDVPDVKARLQKLMGKDFAVMKKVWNVESPIEITGKIIRTSGCEQHNCGPNQWVMFVDTDTDNINVYHTGDENKTYFEKGKIDLPPKYADEVETSDQDDDL
jgi:hypothetical protein